jgi:hypothetical protein
MSETYLIHDNGGRPFKVVINQNCVQVHKQIHDGYSLDYHYEIKPSYAFVVNQVFVGKCPSRNPEFDGNTILLHMKDNEYIWIGNRGIVSFLFLSKVVKYVSEVGNSNVPYPFAIDENDNIYLLLDNVIIKKKDGYYGFDNPYGDYYRNHRMTGFHDIKSFYIGNDKYNMEYYPFPEKDYDRFVKDIGSPLSIIKTNDEKIILDKTSYINLINEFGECHSFTPLPKLFVYQTRMW